MEEKPLIGRHEFGESEYGQRLEYSSSKYRDVVFGIAYYIHLAIIIGVGAYLWIDRYPVFIDNDTNNDWQSNLSLTGLFIGLLGCLICGILFGLLWLQIMKRYPSRIIKVMLFLNIACWIAVTLIGVFIHDMVLTIIGCIILLINILWTWCIWDRIPFAAALLSVSSSITSEYEGTIFLSLLVIIFDVLWIFIWTACFSAYLLVEPDPNSFVLFLFFVSFYWAFQVHQNISHCTTCGVTASWYFSRELNYNPTPRAFKRTITTSFGSVCFGSLIVAILQALRAIIRTIQNKKNECLTCILLCLLNCIESAVRWFNQYSYAHCAIYGTSFIQSASKTFDLLSKRGILALINDDITGIAIIGASLITGLITCGWGYLFAYLFDSNSNELAIILAAYGFFIGLLLSQTILYVVHSSIICLFVCYAENPAILQQNRPEEYDRITNVKPAFALIFNQLNKV